MTSIGLNTKSVHRRERPLLRAFAVATFLWLTFSAASFAQDAAGPVVSVTGGRAQGRTLSDGGGAVFKGIPFAAAPVGDLRWREPQPVKAWTGIRQAGDYAATCAQTDNGWNKNSVLRSSEDCLFLNVWAPEWPSTSKKAVMVWIHGGGNNGGSTLGSGGIEPPFDGEKLARHGVVFVTIEYRLGIFGFMGHPELTAESPHHASGGYGLLDQVAALQWVQDNIAKFGGDPSNVTLFGQSAGAQNTTLLAASPVAKGLFQKAIAESGSPMISDKRLQTPAQMEQLGVILAQSLKAPSTGTIKYLRGLSVAQILAAVPDARKEMAAQHLILDVGMDGYVVPQFSPAVYRSGKEAPIPMIFGNNGHEPNGGGPGGLRPGAAPLTPAEQREALKSRIQALYGSYPDLSEQALRSYGFSGPANDLSTDPAHGDADAQFGTDIFMRCETVILSAWHNAVAPTYEYEFNAGNLQHPPVHSAELDFVFGYLRDQASDPPLNKLSQQMQQYWTNFAKTGDPNGEGLPPWPKAAGQAYIDFANEGPLRKSALRSATCAIYAEKLNRDIDARMK